MCPSNIFYTDKIAQVFVTVVKQFNNSSGLCLSPKLSNRAGLASLVSFVVTVDIKIPKPMYNDFVCGILEGQLMPITIICDECSESHRVREDAVGKRFKCKGCGKGLMIEAPRKKQAASAEEDYEDYDDDDEVEDYDDAEPVRRRGRKSKGGSSNRSKIGRAHV